MKVSGRNAASARTTTAMDVRSKLAPGVEVAPRSGPPPRGICLGLRIKGSRDRNFTKSWGAQN
jgi:hypothetical protein